MSCDIDQHNLLLGAPLATQTRLTYTHTYTHMCMHAYTDIFVYFVESVASEQSSEWPVTHRQKTKCRPFAFLDCFLVTSL